MSLTLYLHKQMVVVVRNILIENNWRSRWFSAWVTLDFQIKTYGTHNGSPVKQSQLGLKIQVLWCHLILGEQTQTYREQIKFWSHLWKYIYIPPKVSKNWNIDVKWDFQKEKSVI